MPRLRDIDILLNLCIARAQHDGYIIEKVLRPPRGNENLGWVDDDHEPPRIVLYPHIPEETHHPPARTLLHELLHVGGDWDGDFESFLILLEASIWKRLRPKQKALLEEMLERGKV